METRTDEDNAGNCVARRGGGEDYSKCFASWNMVCIVDRCLRILQWPTGVQGWNCLRVTVPKHLNTSWILMEEIMLICGFFLLIISDWHDWKDIILRVTFIEHCDCSGLTIHMSNNFFFLFFSFTKREELCVCIDIIIIITHSYSLYS